MKTTSIIKRKEAKADAPRKSVLAIAAHPDDIEFTMAGTLLLLAERGWDVHYLNVANGNGGSTTLTRAQIAKKRLAEAKASCKLAGFKHHPPFADDMQILYTTDLLARTLAVVRAAKPSIILTQSLGDYMEDHQNAARLAVSAGFAKGIKNAPCRPARPVYPGDVAVYHGMPHGLRNMMGKLIRSGLWVDIAPVLETKKAMLGCHQSQKQWLDATQGMDSYIQTMADLSAAMGKMSGKFAHAEGWRRHNPLGYSADPGFDPLREALGKSALIDKKYAKWLDE